MRILCKGFCALLVGAMVLTLTALAADEKSTGDKKPAGDKARAGREGPRRPGAIFGMGAAGLLLNRSVQEELKITDEQRGKFKAAAEEYRHKHQKELERIRELKGKERFEKTRELVRSTSGEVRGAVKGILTEPQLKRLRQIELQQQGVLAFGNPRIQKELKLSEKQRKEIRHIAEEGMNEAGQAWREAKGDREAAAKKLREVRHHNLDKTMKVLNADQRNHYKEMVGSPFRVRYEGGPGGRRPGGGKGRSEP